MNCHQVLLLNIAMYAVNCSILHSMHEAIYIICPTLYFCHGKKLYFPLHSMHPIHWKFSLVFPTPPISHLSEISSRLPAQFSKSPTISQLPARKRPNQGTRMENSCKFSKRSSQNTNIAKTVQDFLQKIPNHLAI